MLYSITSQTLTPIGDISKLDATYGIFHVLVQAPSERKAIEKAVEAIVDSYKDDEDVEAIASYTTPCVSVLDEEGHIVNHYWGFKGHEI